MGAENSCGWVSDSRLQRPSTFPPGSAGGDWGWAKGEGSPGQQRLRGSLTPRGAPGAMVMTAAAQADNELASATS